MAGKYVLGYSADTVSEPILWKLTKDFDIRVNILRAEISPGQEGNLLVELDTPSRTGSMQPWPGWNPSELPG